MAKRKRKTTKRKSDSLSAAIRASATMQELDSIVTKMKPAERVALTAEVMKAAERIKGA